MRTLWTVFLSTCAVATWIMCGAWAGAALGAWSAPDYPPPWVMAVLYLVVVSTLSGAATSQLRGSKEEK